MSFFAFTLILLAVLVVVSIAASVIRSRTFKLYASVEADGVTARKLSRAMLRLAGEAHTLVSRGDFFPYTFYSPLNNRVYIDEDLIEDNSIRSLSLAAFETAHFLKQKSGSRLMLPREILMRVTYILRLICWPALIIGTLFKTDWLVCTASYMFILPVFLSLVLLPTELDCAKRAQRVITRKKLLNDGCCRALEQLGLAHALNLTASMIDIIAAIARMLVRMCADAGKQEEDE